MKIILKIIINLLIFIFKLWLILKRERRELREMYTDAIGKASAQEDRPQEQGKMKQHSWES